VRHRHLGYGADVSDERFRRSSGVGPGLAYHTGGDRIRHADLHRLLQQRGMPLGTAMAFVIAVAGLTVATVIWFGPETRGTRFEAQ